MTVHLKLFAGLSVWFCSIMTYGGAWAQPGDSGDPSPVIEVSIWGGHLDRGGNAINSSAGPPTEIDDFALAGVEFLTAFPVTQNALVQFELGIENAFYDDFLDDAPFPPAPASDTYSHSLTFGGHLAFRNDQLLLGLMGGAGRVDIENGFSSTSQDAEFYFGGLTAQLMFGQGSLALQAGLIDSDADDHEVIDDAVFARLIAELFFNNGQTRLQADLGYGDGEQDTDDIPANPIEFFSWGLELEQALGLNLGNASTSLFVSYQGLRIDEQSTTGLTDQLTDHTLLLGLRIKGGVGTLRARSLNTAPRLPKVARWLGAAPAVD